MKINILDCTLRDGGYINDWKFTNAEISKIIDSLEKSSINIIECGYLNDKNGQVKNSTLYDSLDTADKILSNSDSLIQKVIMINLGDYDIDKLKSKNETVIDGIRLAFHKKDLDLAIKEANKIIQLGYKLFFQPMVTKNYTEIDFLSLVEKINQLNPHAFYIVDSFGSMTEKKKKSRQFSRSLYVAEDIKKGEAFTEKNIRSARPGYGMHPKYLKSILGKVAQRNYRFGDRFDK